MKPLIFILLFFFVSHFEVFAQTPDSFQQTIRGSVVDEDSQSPIIGANVIILNTDPMLGTTTDLDGRFKIENVPVGRQTLSVSYLGYMDQAIPNLLVGSGKELVLNINMTESIVQLDVVTITADAGNRAKALNEMAIVGARSFSVEETKRYAAGIGDPARMVTAFAGVASNGGDDQNAIVIRGNSPRGLLWRLEGVEIPNPNHFASVGASSGAVSILSTNTLSKSDFYTGAFPAEFGNALSGAFDIKLRNGNNEKREYAFQASFLGIEAALEGPFSKNSRASYLVNYRYSTLGLFQKLGINIAGEDNETNYQDAAFKFNFPSQKLGTFSFYGIGGLSQDNENTAGDAYKSLNKSDVGALGLNHLISLNKKSYLKSFVAISGTRLTAEDTEIGSDFNYERIEDKSKNYFRAGTKLRNKISRQHTLESGFTYSRVAYNFKDTESLSLNGNPAERTELFNEQNSSFVLQGYGSWKYRLTEQISFISGLHILHFGLSKNTAIEPRSAIKWQMNPKQSFAVGFGLHSRIESLEYYLANITASDGSVSQANRDLDFTKASHFVLSYDHIIGKNWYIKAESYYQRLFNVPVTQQTNSIFSSLLLEDGFVADSLVNNGTGNNYGLELTVQRFFDKGIYFLFSSSIYEANYTASDGQKRNTPFGSDFGFNFLGGKEFALGEAKQNLLGLNLRATWGGNKRFIPIDLEASRQAGDEIRDFGAAYDNRLPDFWKIDFQISYRINKQNLTHEFRLELFNMTNHKNIDSYFYNNNNQQIESDDQTGIIPALGYRTEF